MGYMIISTITGFIFSIFFAYYTTRSTGDGYGAMFLLGMTLNWIGGGLFWLNEVRGEEREKQERSAEFARRIHSEVARDREASIRTAARVRQERVERLTAIPSEAVAAYRGASWDLAQADQCLQHAARYRSDGAGPPFWEAIESALGFVGHHNEKVVGIERLAREYSSTIRSSSEWLNGGTVSFPAFPDGLLLGEEAATPVLERIGRCVYDAQRDPHFAVIFEMRRNTAAVIAGFQGVTAAITGLSMQIHQAYGAMGSSLNDVSASISAASRATDRSLDVRAPTGLGSEVHKINTTLGALAKRS